MIASRLYSIIEEMRSTTDTVELDKLYGQAIEELHDLYVLLRTTEPKEKPAHCACGGNVTLIKENHMWVITCKRCGRSIARNCTKDELLEYWKERNGN